MKNSLTGMAILAAFGFMLPFANAATDLKAYYEQQKAEIAPSFMTPRLGSEVSITLAAGQKRSGILMKLSEESLSLMIESKMISYKRTVLHEVSRADFFAKDYAHLKALEKVREYKKQLYMEDATKELANTHDAKMSVSAKVDKSTDKNVEEEEKGNERTGATITRTITTRSYSAIQRLKMTIANNTTHSDTYTLAWYFYGKNRAGKTVSLHDSGTRKVTVGGKKRLQETATSKKYVVEKVSTLTENSQRSNSTDPKLSESGTETAGWLVLLKYGEEIMDKKASSKTFLTDEWLNKVK